ncbi:hypothetical protein D3C83_212850 [compost metagenome]
MKSVVLQEKSSTPPMSPTTDGMMLPPMKTLIAWSVVPPARTMIFGALPFANSSPIPLFWVATSGPFRRTLL